MRSPTMMAVVGPDLRIRSINMSFTDAFGKPDWGLVGMPIGDAIGCSSQDVSMTQCGDRAEYKDCILLGRLFDTVSTGKEHYYVKIKVARPSVEGFPDKYYSLSIARMRDNDNGDILISIYDVTDIYEIGKYQSLANNKIRLISSFTRHDIRNVLTSLSGNIQLAEMKVDQSDVKIRLEKAMQDVDRIITLLDSSKDYLEIGSKEAEWTDLRKALERGTADLDLGTVDFISDLSAIDILVDPMLMTVFQDLLADLLKHGGEVSRIEVASKMVGEDLILSLKEYGKLIDPNKNYFDPVTRSTEGHRLQMIKEILDLTDIRIKVVPCSDGALLEAVVPPGRFRIHQDARSG